MAQCDPNSLSASAACFDAIPDGQRPAVLAWLLCQLNANLAAQSGGSFLTNVRNFGVVGDGTTDDTNAIKTAVASASIYFPAGTYVVSDQLPVPSNRRILLMPGAIIFRKAGTGKQNSANFDNANFWVNSDPVGGNTNIIIEGGVYDGNQANQPDVNFTINVPLIGGCGLRFLNVTNLTIRDITIQNNITYNLQVGNVSSFILENIRFVFSGTRTHQDGIHVNGPASYGTIRNIWSNGGNDDLVALNANDDTFGLMSQGHIDNILIDTVVCNPSGAAINPYCGSGFRLLNSTYNITNVTARNYHGYYQIGGVVCMTAAEGAPSGYIDNVIIEDFDVNTLAVNDPFIIYELVAKNITIRNCRWRPGTGAADLANGVGYGQQFCAFNVGSVDNLILDGIQVVDKNDVSATPFAFRNTIANLIMTNVIFNTTGGTQTYLIDFSASPHVTKCVVSDVIANSTTNLNFGTATGTMTTSGIINP